MKKEDFLELSKKILVNATDEVLIELEKEYDFIHENIIFLKNINVEGVEPMVRISSPLPYETLREDIEEPHFKKEKWLQNSNNNNNKSVIIKRTIK